MIHLSPLPHADRALELELEPIDAMNPLVLPADWRQHPPAPVEFSGSVSAAAGVLSCSPTAPLHEALPPSAGADGQHAQRSPAEPAPPPSSPVAPVDLTAGQEFFAAVAAERRRQVEKFGHTPEQDLRGRFRNLTDPAQRYVGHANEDMHFRGEQYRDQARRHLARAGAMLAAAWDFIDNGGGQ